MKEKILTKELKIIILNVLKCNVLKRIDAEMITKGFDVIEFTDEQFKQALEKIKPKKYDNENK